MPALRTLLASGTLLLAGGAGLAVATDQFQAFTSETARVVDVREHPRALPAATLESQDGARLLLADLHGKWVLVDFIYTRCLTYCTVLGREFAQLQTLLAPALAEGKVQLLSISFDPENDTPARLARYLAHSGDHGGGWLAARPVDDKSLRDLECAFGLTVIPDGLGGFVHNAAIEIVDPQGRLVGIVPMGDPRLAAQQVMQGLQ